MLTRGQAFVEAGQVEYEERYRQRVVQNLTRRAHQLGFQLTPEATSSAWTQTSDFSALAGSFLRGRLRERRIALTVIARYGLSNLPILPMPPVASFGDPYIWLGSRPRTEIEGEMR